LLGSFSELFLPHNFFSSQNTLLIKKILICFAPKPFVLSRKKTLPFSKTKTSAIIFQATQKLYRHQFLQFQRMAHHVFPYLIGILLSAVWTAVLGIVECFDSDMGIASGYFAFARRLMMNK
jgi:hypothetical protein